MSEAAPTTRTEPKPARTPLGQRSKAQAAATKQRIVGNSARIPVLDVAAFNSFIG